QGHGQHADGEPPEGCHGSEDIADQAVLAQTSCDSPEVSPTRQVAEYRSFRQDALVLTTPRPAVVVVNYASADLAADALRPFESTSWTIVLVDCWSSAAERERISELGAASGWRLVLPQVNLGFGAGVNA